MTLTWTNRTQPGRNGNGAALVPPTTAFGAQLRRLRLARGVSQEWLAIGANCDTTTVSRLESGSRGVSLGMVRRLAAALELTDDEGRELWLALWEER